MRSWSVIKIVVFFVLSAICLYTMSYLFGTLYLPEINKEAFSAVSNTKYRTVIIDAGHGGEDGGTSSADGLIEKHINLDIAMMLRDLLSSCGVNVVMTRTEDKLLYDRNVDYTGRKKKLDLAARLAIAEKTEGAVFVSIHMNSYTDPKYSGLQVWYSQNDPDSIILAELIQSFNREKLQPDNKRKTKAATSSIRLLNEATCPAVLVECGFLSNAQEAKKFEDVGYKQKVAFVLFCSIINFLDEGGSLS